jgi:hypothetical protein
MIFQRKQTPQKSWAEIFSEIFKRKLNKERKRNMRFQGTACNVRQDSTLVLAGLILTGLLGLAEMSIAIEDTWTQKADMPTLSM